MKNPKTEPRLRQQKLTTIYDTGDRAGLDFSKIIFRAYKNINCIKNKIHQVDLSILSLKFVVFWRRN